MLTGLLTLALAPAWLYLRALQSSGAVLPLSFVTAVLIVLFFRLVLVVLILPILVVPICNQWPATKGAVAVFLVVLLLTIWAMTWNLQVALPRLVVLDHVSFRLLMNGLVLAGKLESFTSFYLSALALVVLQVAARDETRQSPVLIVQSGLIWLLAVVAAGISVSLWNSATGLIL